jgi:hypothetical protein
LEARRSLPSHLSLDLIVPISSACLPGRRRTCSLSEKVLRAAADFISIEGTAWQALLHRTTALLWRQNAAPLRDVLIARATRSLEKCGIIEEASLGQLLRVPTYGLEYPLAARSAFQLDLNQQPQNEMS